MTKRHKSQIISFARCFSLVLISTLLLTPFTVLADSLVLVDSADAMDMLRISVVQKAKLSATLNMDKKGDLVVQCLNLFSVPVAHTPFGDNPVIQKLAQRTRLHLESKGRGAFVKLSFLF